ncbi:MAG: endonuclease/exonuclease/phosphatase family protein [Rhodospirillaceae bacterium]
MLVLPNRGYLPILARLALFMLAVALLAGPAVAKNKPVALRVLSYNIHGLPALIAKDDPEGRIPIITRKAGEYDVVLFQEDFSHNALVDANASHGIIVRGNGPSGTANIKGVAVPISTVTGLMSGFGVSKEIADLAATAAKAAQPFGSGLTALVRRGTAEVIDQQREAFGICEGYKAAAQDCFAEKGVLMVRLRLSAGVEVDVYNTHLDAGEGARDQSIRVRQLGAITAFMKRHSQNRAVIFGGDFNMDWKNRTQRAAFERFLKSNGLTRLATNQDGRHIDHILVRSARSVHLTVRQAAVAPGFDKDGTPLSDHPPLFLDVQLVRR